MQRPQSPKRSDVGASQTVNNPPLIVGVAGAFIERLSAEVSRVTWSDLHMGKTGASGVAEVNW